MKRRNYSDKEQDQLKRLQRENTKLKKQIASLRKQLSRIDLDRYSHLKDIIEAHEDEDEAFDIKESIELEKKKWECFDCTDGILRLVMVWKAGVPFYLRKCDGCAKKTKLKRYDETVKGVKNED